MSFPLSALDYGSRRRLRELTTPAEAYDLQIAAPYFDGIHPIQKIEPLLSTVIFSNCNHVCDNSRAPLELDGRLYKVHNTLEFFNITSNYNTAIFHHFVFMPIVVHFVNCDLTSAFLQSISARTRRYPVHLKIHDCTSHDGVTFELICKLFKTSHTLDLSNNSFLNRSWIYDLITNNYSNMDIIWITAPISILNIDQSQFVKFVEAQRQHFRIFITLPNNNDDLEVEQSLDRLFSRHFEVWPFDEYGDYCGRTIYINWMSSGIRRERAYLFPKDCDPRAYLYIPKKKDKKCTVM